jgi:hypothetical protein
MKFVISGIGKKIQYLVLHRLICFSLFGVTGKCNRVVFLFSELQLGQLLNHKLLHMLPRIKCSVPVEI